MPSINIKIKNLPQIKAAFAMSPQIMTKNLNKAIKLSAYNISRRAIENAPAKTGRLRTSINDGTKIYNLKAVIKPEVDYAYYVHEGTGIYAGHKPYYANIDKVGWRYMLGMKPRRFLYEAVESQDDEVQKYFVDAVQNTLNAIGRTI